MKKKILIVDDEPDIVTTTRYILEDAGYEVYAAGDSKAAFAQLTSAKPDLVLLDLLLPGEDTLPFSTPWLRRSPATVEQKYWGSHVPSSLMEIPVMGFLC